ncbi:MAG: dihydrofolate reductase [Brachybacterium sp.]|nr:dihydrofolate reductase [Brachybacterium sp.]
MTAGRHPSGWRPAVIGVIFSGRRGDDAARARADLRDELTAAACAGAFSGVEIVLTHPPHELAASPPSQRAGRDVAEAVRRAKRLADGGDIRIISADIARQALALELIDELRMVTAPALLGACTSSTSPAARTGDDSGPAPQEGAGPAETAEVDQR